MKTAGYWALGCLLVLGCKGDPVEAPGELSTVEAATEAPARSVHDAIPSDDPVDTAELAAPKPQISDGAREKKPPGATTAAGATPAVARVPTAAKIAVKTVPSPSAVSASAAAPTPVKAPRQAQPSEPCPSLSSAGFAAGSYAFKRDPALKLTLVEGCEKMSTLAHGSSNPVAQAIVARRLEPKRRRTSILMEEGDLCGGYILSPNSAGNVVVSWETDIGSASTLALIEKGCRDLTGEYVRSGTRQVKAPSPCNIRKQPWQSVDEIPGFERHGDPEWHDEISEVFHGDLDRDGSEEAYVLVVTAVNGFNGSYALHAFDMNPDCTLRDIGGADAGPAGHWYPKIRVAGRRLTLDVNFSTDDDCPGYLQRDCPFGTQRETWTVKRSKFVKIGSQRLKAR